MTEALWLSFQDPDQLLSTLDGRTASPRTLRLFAIACCRRVLHLLPEVHQEAIEVLDRWIDDADLWLVMDTAQREMREVASQTRNLPSSGQSACAAAWAAAQMDAWLAASGTARKVAEAIAFSTDPTVTIDSDSFKAEYRGLMPLLRDLFRNPFRQSPFDPALRKWESGMVVKIAEGIYQEHAFDQLPILADALEDAGCADAEILAHLRSPGPHVRGCWALDLIVERDR